MRLPDGPPVGVATVTLVRDPREEPVLRGALTTLSESGLQAVVADGGSGEAFESFLRSLRGVTLARPERAGLVPQVKAALAGAMSLRTEYVLYSESDKQFFFAERMPAFVRHAELSRGAGVVIAGRSDGSYATFPAVQRYAEGVINRLTGDALGIEGDYSYGPFLVHRELLPFVERASDEFGWGWRHFMFAVAHRLGRGVSHVVDDYPCPEDQRDQSAAEWRHRTRQLAQNINGLLGGLAVNL